MAELWIGGGKSARPSYSFDEVAIVPNRRTRNPDDVDISWQLDAYRLDLPVLAAGMDGVMTPAGIAEMGRLGGIGALDLEGLWTRYDDPRPFLAELSEVPLEGVSTRLRELRATEVDHDLLVQRLRELRAAGGLVAGSVTPQRVAELLPLIRRAEPDLLVIHSPVLSAEHLSSDGEPLDLKSFVRSVEIPVVVGSCASTPTALHLMRTGAAGVLVGVGTGRASRTRQGLGVGVPAATAIADVRAARDRHLDETGVYVHVIAAGGLNSGGDIAKAVVCGADAVMLGSVLAAASDAPASGRHWGASAAHPEVPHGKVVQVDPVGSLEEILVGPGDGEHVGLNLCGTLRRAMAVCGYATLKDFQRAELVTVQPTTRGEW